MKKRVCPISGRSLTPRTTPSGTASINTLKSSRKFSWAATLFLVRFLCSINVLFENWRRIQEPYFEATSYSNNITHFVRKYVRCISIISPPDLLIETFRTIIELESLVLYFWRVPELQCNITIDRGVWFGFQECIRDWTRWGKTPSHPCASSGLTMTAQFPASGSGGVRIWPSRWVSFPLTSFPKQFVMITFSIQVWLLKPNKHSWIFPTCLVFHLL